MRFVSLVAILVATAGLAEDLATPPSPAPPPAWSLGAGITFFVPTTTAVLGAGALPGLGSLTTLSFTPITPSVSIERVFSPRFALGLGLEASLQSAGGPRAANAGLAGNETSSGSIGVGVSPRFVMTAPEAPVSFTIYGSVFAGYAGQSLGILAGVMPSTSSSVSVGVGGGVAFELRLLERLSVRAQANLVRLSVTRLGIAIPSAALVPMNETVFTTVSANVIPSPSLELRLYF